MTYNATSNQKLAIFFPFMSTCKSNKICAAVIQLIFFQ
uniref:Uncharacterized protein n=1 Tax=Rhizophora mucronata TaxID=61149 RepID=A0A2P2NJE3_RHIMU